MSLKIDDTDHTGDEGKKGKSNAKAVDAFDLDGNLIASYPSGSIASQALGIQQGDISLCCRGLKASIGNYKFKFSADHDDNNDNIKLRRGYALEVVAGDSADKRESSSVSTSAARASRNSRGEYANIMDYESQINSASSIMEISAVKPRKWNKVYVKVGSFVVQKWKPDVSHPTSELQKFKTLRSEKKKPLRRNAARTKA